MTTTIYFIRHAQSHPSIKLDESAWPLSHQGREQAEALPELLESLGIEQLFSSPYVRCVETVRPYSNANSLEIVLREGLHERNISGGIDRNFYETWRRSWEDFSFRMPRCESSADAQTRFLAAVNGILSEPVGGTIGICSHGNVIGLLLNAIDLRCILALRPFVDDPTTGIAKVRDVSAVNQTPISHASASGGLLNFGMLTRGIGSPEDFSS